MNRGPAPVLPPNWPSPDRPLPSTPPIPFNHGHQVHLWVQPIIGLQVYLPTRSIMASKCISKFTRVWPPCASLSVLDLGLQDHLWVHRMLASKSISEFTGSRPLSASPNSLNLSVVNGQSYQAGSLLSVLCHVSHNIWRVSVRISSSFSKSVCGWWADMKGYSMILNHTHCVDIRRIGKISSGTAWIASIYESSARVRGAKSWERLILYCVEWDDVYLPCGLANISSLSLSSSPLCLNHLTPPPSLNQCLFPWISIWLPPASPCQTEWRWWWEMNFPTTMASKSISKLSESASPGAPLIMLEYRLWPDWPYVHIQSNLDRW